MQAPPPPTTVKISQVYGGGGNSGSTYTNDFIEIFNQSAVPVNISGWSVQYAGATVTTPWNVTPLCTSAPCYIQPGHYYLIQESAGAGGTTALPTADASGGVLMSGTQAKVALVASTVALTGACPSDPTIVDKVGYGAANCCDRPHRDVEQHHGGRTQEQRVHRHRQQLARLRDGRPDSA